MELGIVLNCYDEIEKLIKQARGDKQLVSEVFEKIPIFVSTPAVVKFEFTDKFQCMFLLVMREFSPYLKAKTEHGLDTAHGPLWFYFDTLNNHKGFLSPNNWILNLGVGKEYVSPDDPSWIINLTLSKIGNV